MSPFFYTFRGFIPPSSLGIDELVRWAKGQLGYAELCEWADEAFEKTRVSVGNASSFPPFNAYQLKDGAIRLDFAFAGYKKGDITLSFEGDSLHLSSDGSQTKPGDDCRPIKNGLKLSGFDVSYSLAPDKFDTKKAQAKFEDGVLTITIPLAEAKKPNKVDIA